MKILALLRMTPDPDAQLELNADASGLDREWLDPKLNDFNDHALEEAVLLKEATGGLVIAVAVGEGSNRTLQMAIARGATSAVSIEWPSDQMISTPAIAHTVAALARNHDIDLVVTGVQTSEDVGGQAASFLGGMLGWAHVSGTNQVTCDADGTLIASRKSAEASSSPSFASRRQPSLGFRQRASRPVMHLARSCAKPPGTPIESVPLGDALPMLPMGELKLPKGGSAERLGSSPQSTAERLASILVEKGFLRSAP